MKKRKTVSQNTNGDTKITLDSIKVPSYEEIISEIQGKTGKRPQLPKGLPEYLRNKREVKSAIEDLLRQGFLLSKPTNYGLEVSLNIKKKKEIENFIEEGL